MKPEDVKIIIEGDIEIARINLTKAVAQLTKKKFTDNEIAYLITKLQEGGAGE
ncbi:hypothetical protein Q3V94_00490 [Caloramator sp. CAR-1]|uniref:hypothetical protein n=1 Tax=Caloramator sp. CAR-1 TaxID=3062777 RepID=UPI0026E20A18|nr:hypothetical protein [Caloramator sp. CAR-1]MDO6353561.1 hypothetical protein [Caloramator sp. CAR-1]